MLHKVLILWKEGKAEEMKKILTESGWGSRDTFYRVAQAIAETLPPGNQEKRLLEGFLSGKEKLINEIREVIRQRRLFK